VEDGRLPRGPVALGEFRAYRDLGSVNVAPKVLRRREKTIFSSLLRNDVSEARITPAFAGNPQTLLNEPEVGVIRKRDTGIDWG